MRYFLTQALICLCFFSLAQKRSFKIHQLSLPPELSYYDNQFSGLFISSGRLFLMSESRIEDKAEAKLYSINLYDIDLKLKDSSYVLPYRKYPIYGLETLRESMKKQHADFEGLEAMVIDDDNIWFSVETPTPDNVCFLLKGNLYPKGVILDTDSMVAMKKPVAPNGDHIYNAGFEAMTMMDRNLYAFFEYNSFADNYVKMYSPGAFRSKGDYRSVFINPLPFRITDITKTGKSSFTAINYFYKGGGDDSVYRVPVTDTENDKLIRDSKGYKSYCRLINLDFNGTLFKWNTLWEFPEPYNNYNWEGLAAYEKGYLIINDKYTPSRPYSSTLLYLSEE